MSSSLVVLNPHAAASRAARLAPALQQWLKDQAPATPLLRASSVGETCGHITCLPPGSRVVIVGGDGTLNRLLPAVLQGQHSLGLVPYGSGNDAARALGLYRLPWQRALPLALQAPARAMDIGLAQFERQPEAGLEAGAQAVPFFSSLTAGFDSAVGLRAQTQWAWLRGQPRYLAATLAELLVLRNWPLQVHLDGDTVYQGPALFASLLNTPSYGSGMPAVPHASIEDGQLNLLLAKKFDRLATLGMLPRLLLGKHLADERVLTQPARSVEIESSTPLPLAADGEYLGCTQRLRVEIRAASLPVVRGP